MSRQARQPPLKPRPRLWTRCDRRSAPALRRLDRAASSSKLSPIVTDRSFSRRRQHARRTTEARASDHESAGSHQRHSGAPARARSPPPLSAPPPIPRPPFESGLSAQGVTTRPLRRLHARRRIRPSSRRTPSRFVGPSPEIAALTSRIRHGPWRRRPRPASNPPPPRPTSKRRRPAPAPLPRPVSERPRPGLVSVPRPPHAIVLGDLCDADHRGR